MDRGQEVWMGVEMGTGWIKLREDGKRKCWERQLELGESPVRSINLLQLKLPENYEDIQAKTPRNGGCVS